MTRDPDVRETDTTAAPLWAEARASAELDATSGVHTCGPACQRQACVARRSPRFDGATYSPQQDKRRLLTLLDRVFATMSDGTWRTLAEIRVKAGGSEAGVSARLRDLRKPKWGAYRVDHRRREGGLWEYRLLLRPENDESVT